MGEKPIYAIPSLEDDPLVEIARGCPEPSYPLDSALPSPCSPFTEDEWQEISSLGVSPRQLLREDEKEEGGEEWNSVGLWLADNDLYEGLWELDTDGDEEMQEDESDDGNDDENYGESLFRFHCWLGIGLCIDLKTQSLSVVQ